MIALSVGVAIIVAALFAPWIARWDPLRVDIDQTLAPPSEVHWLGTDDLGRDVFARAIWGARLSLYAAALVLMISVAAGTTFGLVAGFYGGLVDQLLMRLTDVFLAFPALILAMAVVAALGPGLINAALAIGLVWWPSYARLVRGQVVAARSLPYVEAARAYGAGDVRLMTRHILPNTFGPVAVRIPVTGANAILMLAGLSFIGLGAQPPTPEWGLMIAQARRYLFTAWWYPTVIGLILFISVLAFTLASDSLQDMFDARTVRRRAALERG